MSTSPLFLTCLLILFGAELCFSKELTSNRLEDRFTRQTDRNQCSAQFRSISCSTAGLAQIVVDTNSQYGQYREAYRAYVGCTRQENGEFCAREISPAISLALLRCQSSLSLSSSCSENCRQAVENLAEFGCCVNSIYNISREIFNVNPEEFATELRYTQLFQNNLWARCGVDDLGICRNDVEIQVRESDQPCPGDRTEIGYQMYIDIYCNRNNLLPVVNALRNESDENSCYNFVLDEFRRSCEQKTNGAFCISESLQSNSQAEIRRQCDSLRNNDLSTNCFCTSSCRDAIQSFRNEFECCVDTVNRSMINPFLTDSQLWECCGVETVDTRCMDTLTSGSPAEGVQPAIVVVLFIAYNYSLH